MLTTFSKLDTKTIKAGDVIYIAKPSSWAITITPAIAKRVTAGGQVVVDGFSGEFKFSNRGSEVGQESSRYARYLTTKDRYEYEEKRIAEKKAHDAIRAAITATKDVPMADLCEALRKIQVMITTLEADKMMRSEK